MLLNHQFHVKSQSISSLCNLQVKGKLGNNLVSLQWNPTLQPFNLFKVRITNFT